MQTLSTTSATTATLNGFSRSIPGRITLGLAATAIVACLRTHCLPAALHPRFRSSSRRSRSWASASPSAPPMPFFILLAYLAEGLCGLPVFSHTGPGGVAQLLGPTGGFLMAYPFVAAIAGGLTRLAPPAAHPGSLPH